MQVILDEERGVVTLSPSNRKDKKNLKIILQERGIGELARPFCNVNEIVNPLGPKVLLRSDPE